MRRRAAEDSGEEGKLLRRTMTSEVKSRWPASPRCLRAERRGKRHHRHRPCKPRGRGQLSGGHSRPRHPFLGHEPVLVTTRNRVLYGDRPEPGHRRHVSLLPYNFYYPPDGRRPSVVERLRSQFRTRETWEIKGSVYIPGRGRSPSTSHDGDYFFLPAAGGVARSPSWTWRRWSSSTTSRSGAAIDINAISLRESLVADPGTMGVHVIDPER